MAGVSEAITWNDIMAMYGKLSDYRPASDTPARMEVHEDVPPRLVELFGILENPAWLSPPPWTMFGIPVVVKLDMLPGQWRIVAVDGSVMREGIWLEEPVDKLASGE